MIENQKTFKAAVIGLGFIGAGDQVSGTAIGQKVSDLDGTHAQALVAHPQIRLVAGSSRDEGRQKRFAEYQSVKTYADWRKMLTTEKPDIVSIATNSPYHAEITEACAEEGVRAVLCEKPIATRLSDADRAISICQRQGTLLVINHSRRWHPLWCAARDEIGGGTIGEVHLVVVNWPTGRLGNVGTHMFDALRMLLGAEAKEVSGTLDPVLSPDCRGTEYRDPGGWGIVAFSNGIKAFIDAPTKSKAPLLMRIVGSVGQMTIRNDNALIELWSGKTRTLSVPKIQNGSLSLAVQDIVKCLISGEQPSSTGKDGLAALEMIIGFHVSDRLRGQWVPLPIRDADRQLEVRIG